MPTIKIYCDEEVRRMNVTQELLSDFAAVKEKIALLLSTKPSLLQVKWNDNEGDKITIESAEDFKEAVSSLNAFNAPSILHLQVKISTASETVNISTSVNTSEVTIPAISSGMDALNLNSAPQVNSAPPSYENLESENIKEETPSNATSDVSGSNPHPHHGHQHCRQRHFRQRRDELPEIDSQGRKIHRSVTCDMCQSPIYGIRYKCTECNDYDMCQDCEAKEEHPAGHATIKIRIPTHVQLYKPYGNSGHRWGGCRQRWGQYQQQHQHQHQQQQQQQHQHNYTPNSQHHYPQYQQQFVNPPFNPNWNNWYHGAPHQINVPQVIVPQPSQYETLLVQLESMGFSDRETNQRLLESNRGDITAVIDQLMM